jgi:curved DNA-binding protein CbpA
MSKILPDYYSILKVPPDASPEVIKASYRRLMVTLKMHPDLGGDHELAAQINEAYAVLGDKVKRVAYARMYLLQRLRTAQAASRAKEHRSSGSASARPGAAAAANAAKSPSDRYCPLCRVAKPQSIGPETRCERCRSPLSPPPQPGDYGHELFGRRRSARIAKTHRAIITPAGQSQGITVKMRDLSLNGISFYCELAMTVEQMFKFRDPTLEAVAVVVSCRKRGPLYSVHARLLTVVFLCRTGVFVSSSG